MITTRIFSGALRAPGRFLEISSFAQGPKSDFSPARFARRLGFTEVFLRILPLRKATTSNFSPARFARRLACTKDPKDFAFAQSQTPTIFAGALRAPYWDNSYSTPR